MTRAERPLASLLKFFSLTYLLTWTCFIAFAMLRTSDGRALTGLSWLLLFVGIFAPGIVALWLTAQAEGRAGLLALLRRLFEWRVGVRWYVFAIGYMAAVKLTVALVHRIAMGAWPLFGPETRHGAWYDTWYAMLAATIFSTAIGGQAGEEIGWRGYALPRLAARLGLARASILLGIIWACWHLPLFFIPGADTFGESFPVYLLSVTALSVAWLGCMGIRTEACCS